MSPAQSKLMSPTACVFFSEHPFVGFAYTVHCLDVCSLGNDPPGDSVFPPALHAAVTTPLSLRPFI